MQKACTSTRSAGSLSESVFPLAAIERPNVHLWFGATGTEGSKSCSWGAEGARGRWVQRERNFGARFRAKRITAFERYKFNLVEASQRKHERSRTSEQVPARPSPI